MASREQRTYSNPEPNPDPNPHPDPDPNPNPNPEQAAFSLPLLPELSRAADTGVPLVVSQEPEPEP